MGEDFRRHATPDEVRRMQAAGAAGPGGRRAGPLHRPGVRPGHLLRPPEVLALARTAAEAGGRYISHIRSEDRWFWAAIDEIITIGRTTGMPVQISHIKLAMRSLWGRPTR